MKCSTFHNKRLLPAELLNNVSPVVSLFLLPQGVTAGVQATVLYDGVVVSGYRTKAMEL